MAIIDLKISKEENFLINILFKERKDFEQEIDLENIDYKLLVKIASRHLMLPSLYINLKNKCLIDLIPLDLKLYLKEIFIINKNRNQILLKEAEEISEKLIHNNINHVFIKSSSYLFNNIYYDIGERMVGDIDFLVSKEDYERTIKLFKKLNYKESKYAFFNSRHYPRLINTKKMFALEVHYELLSSKFKEKLNSELVLNKRIYKKNKAYAPNNKHEILYNIYNFQINDKGSNKLSYSYRSIYDTFMLAKQFKFNLSKIKPDSYINNYFMIIKELKIPIIEFSKIKVKKLNLYRFRIKHLNKLFFNIYNFLINITEKTWLFPKQINEVLINKKYRKYLIKKIFNKF